MKNCWINCIWFENIRYWSISYWHDSLNIIKTFFRTNNLQLKLNRFDEKRTTSNKLSTEYYEVFAFKSCDFYMESIRKTFMSITKIHDEFVDALFIKRQWQSDGKPAMFLIFFLVAKLNIIDWMNIFSGEFLWEIVFINQHNFLSTAKKNFT